MRCKRCGEIMNPGDPRCPVCGKSQTPARRHPPVRKSEENTVRLPQLERFTHTYHQDAARSRTMHRLTAVALVAALVLLVLVYVAVGDLRSTLDTFSQDAQMLLQQPQQTEPTDPTEPTETETAPPPADAKPKPLSQRNVEATLTLDRTAQGSYAAARMIPGADADPAEAWVRTSGTATDRQTGAAFVLEGDRLELVLCDSYGGSGSRFFASLTWVLTGDTFSGYSGAMCSWEYRLPGGEWESMPVSAITAVPDGCEVQLTPEEMTALLGEQTAMEFRCHVSMTHEAGGTLSVTAGGATAE